MQTPHPDTVRRALQSSLIQLDDEIRRNQSGTRGSKVDAFRQRLENTIEELSAAIRVPRLDE
jgi:hypothetical protein